MAKGSRRDIEAGRAFVRLFLKDDTGGAIAQISRNLQKVGAMAVKVGAIVSAAGVAMAAPFAAAAKLFADFDDQMRALGAVTGGTEEEMAMLAATAKRLGESTRFSATQVGTLMTELGRAGFTARQVDEMTASVLNMATASGTDAKRSGEIMAAAIRQFGLEAKDATMVADQFTVAANKSNNTVEQLGEALSYAGPVAADFKMSLGDALTILGGLGDMGIQASNAGTALRRLLTITGAEGAKLQGIFGVAFTDGAGNARNLVDVLSEVHDRTKDLGTAQRAKKFNDAFGLLGITSASAIGASNKSIRELGSQIKNASGAAAEAAQKMDAGLGGAFARFVNQIKNTAIEIGKTIEPALLKIIENASLALKEIERLARGFAALEDPIARMGIMLDAVMRDTMQQLPEIMGHALGRIVRQFNLAMLELGKGGAKAIAVFESLLLGGPNAAAFTALNLFGAGDAPIKNAKGFAAGLAGESMPSFTFSPRTKHEYMKLLGDMDSASVTPAGTTAPASAGGPTARVEPTAESMLQVLRETLAVDKKALERMTETGLAWR